MNFVDPSGLFDFYIQGKDGEVLDGTQSSPTNDINEPSDYYINKDKYWTCVATKTLSSKYLDAYMGGCFMMLVTPPPGDIVFGAALVGMSIDIADDCREQSIYYPN